MTKRIYPLLLLPMLIGLCNLSARAERFTLTGNTFDERCESLINCMVNDIDPYTGNVNIKYTSAYLWARLYAGTDAERALAQLETLYAEVAADPASVTGSDIDFYAHMTMHGYLLCKNQLPGSLIRKMKQFLQGIDFNKRGSVSTLNLDMMRYTAGFFAAQEWSDFTDLNGKNATEVMEYNRPRILHVLDNIYHNNCEEMDAFVYLPSNTMYIRMLAEYAQDSEVQQKAYVVYQQMLASMAGAWNKGLYIACPPRAKGWNHLVAGPYAPNSRATALAWLYFGNPTNSMKMDSNCTSDSNNYGDFLFWVAYKGKLRPMQAIIDAEAGKTFPYEYHSYLDNLVVSASNGTTKKWKYYRYTWQSENYGLATQTEIPYDLSNAAKLYTYKETKRTYLAWHSDLETSQCYFSVCQDNPERPADAENHNAVGYGENPYHRVLQYKGAALGITNVPEDYLGGKYYQLYVPFSTTAIKLRKEVAGDWVLCHTGSMMFAFKTLEPYIISPRLPYSISGYDILMFQDFQNTRKGSWVLQATEITDDLKGADMETELDNFLAKLQANAKVETVDYDSDRPRVRFTTMDGDVLDLTFFPPTEDYAGQYIINGEVQQLGDGYLYNSPCAKQQDKSDDVYIYDNPDNPTVLNWNDPMPPASGVQALEAGGILKCVQQGNLLSIQNIPATGQVNVTLYNETGQASLHHNVTVDDNRCTVPVDTLPAALYVVQVTSGTATWQDKWLKTI